MTDALDPTDPRPGADSVTSRGALVRSSALVAVGTALSRLTGVFRVGALVYALGQTRLSDVYTVANTMPNLVYELLLGGVLSATLVPIFAERVDEEDGGILLVDGDGREALAAVDVSFVTNPG